MFRGDRMTRYKGNDDTIRALDAFIGLMRAADRVSSLAHRGLGSIKLSVSQFGVLEALYHRGPMCQKEIAEKILKSTGNITMVIDNLEKRGLVMRQRNEKDRRFFTIRLMPDGEEIIKGYFPDHARKITGIMNVLSDDELKRLKEICNKLISLL
jgi:MarR family transcriptional regulator, 2-MHQ and catechol-resistance regulon repressor